VSQPEIAARRIGAEAQPIAIVDGFHPDPEGLRAFAVAAAFGPARNHYPGLRADLPPDYFQQVRPSLTAVLRAVFGHAGAPGLIDASFSIVTTPPSALTLPQRLPHVDATDPGRIALVHYLSPADAGGTAFYRHRATGLETLDARRATLYREVLRVELGDHAPQPEYIAGDTALFEQTGAVNARFNRAVIYRSAMLHSGAIPADAPLHPDPATGRLTVTAFLQM
jgi:hypothetical protein